MLLAVTACPSLVIAFGDSPFEAHKAAFLWVAASAGLGAIVSDVPRLKRMLVDRPWTRWLAAVAVASAVALAVSTAGAASPRMAWWGSGLRRHGTVTEIALLSVMAITALLAVDRRRFDRVLAAAVLGSIGPTVYAVSQWIGVDPLAAVPGQRPGSTFGNPLFLSGYFVAVLPLAIAYAASRPSPAQRVIAWGLVLAQGLVLAVVRSSGPLVALAAAGTIAGLMLLASLGHAKTARLMSIGTAVAVAAIVILAPSWMRAGTAADVTFEQILARRQGTIAVRALLWQAAGSGIGADPRTLAFGSGPESITGAITRHAGPALRMLERFEGKDVAPDRAHNETLDRVLGLGMVGLALRFVLLCMALAAAFAALGLLSNAGSVRFGLLAIVAPLVTVSVAWMRQGAWTLAMSVPAALVLIAAIWIAWRPRPGGTAARPLAVAIAATSACWLAHYLEVQTGIASIGSASVGAVGMALTVAWAARTAASPAVSAATPEAIDTISDDTLGIVAGWTAAVLLIALTGAAPRATGAVWMMTAATWALAVLALGLRARAAAISAAVWVSMALLWQGTAAAVGGSPTQAQALADRPSVFAILAAAAFALASWRLMGPSLWRWTALVEGAAVAIAVAIAGPPALQRSEADVLIGSARVCERQGDVACAMALDAEVDRRGHADERSLTQAARLLADQAMSPAAASRRDELFGMATTRLERAWAIDAVDYQSARNRGSVERMWASSLPAPGRAPHLAEADRWYAAATALAPSAPPLWEEWANLKLEQRRPDDALPLLERAVTLGATGRTMVMCDVVLRVAGIDVDTPGGLARAEAMLRERRYGRLADLYAQRAAEAGRVLRSRP